MNRHTDVTKNGRRSDRQATAITGALILAALLLAAPVAPAQAPTALPVATEDAQLQTGYRVGRSFSGRVESSRRSAVGFEMAGRVSAVLVDEGAVVRTGDELARLDTERLEARKRELQAAQTRARAELSLAEATLARTQEAFDLKGVSQQDLDEARERHASLVAGLNLSKSRIDSIEVDLEKSVLRAPYDAIVVRREVDEGQVLPAGQPVVELLETAASEVRIGVTGPALDSIAVGDEVRVTVRKRPVRASIKAILPVRTASTRTVEVVLALNGDATWVRPGDLARLTLGTEVSEPGFWLPVSALTEAGRGLWGVYIANPMAANHPDTGATHELQRRTVEVLYQESDRVYVRGTLRPGDRYVTDGLHRIVAGQQVRLAPGHLVERTDEAS